MCALNGLCQDASPGWINLVQPTNAIALSTHMFFNVVLVRLLIWQRRESQISNSGTLTSCKYAVVKSSSIHILSAHFKISFPWNFLESFAQHACVEEARMVSICHVQSAWLLFAFSRVQFNRHISGANRGNRCCRGWIQPNRCFTCAINKFCFQLSGFCSTLRTYKIESEIFSAYSSGDQWQTVVVQRSVRPCRMRNRSSHPLDNFSLSYSGLSTAILSRNFLAFNN